MADDTNPALEVKKIEEEIVAVKDDLATTPKNEQDEKWKTDLTEALASISDRVETLVQAQPKGQNPEIRALDAKLEAIQQTLAKIQVAPVNSLVTEQIPDKEKSEEGNPTLETPTGISSAPVIPPVAQPRKREEKPKKAWF